MSKQLPNRPSLKHLRNQAKQLLDSHKSGDENACTRFRTHLPRLSEASLPQIRGANLTLRDALLVIAREYDFASWSKLKRHLEDHAVVRTPDGTHRELVQRVAGQIGNRPEETVKTIRRLLEDSDQVGILMISLGQETTAEIMKSLSDEEIEQIAQSISNLNAVTTEQEDEVLQSFEQLLMADKYVSQGGLDYARGALEKAVGERKAQTILKRLHAQLDAVLKRVTKLVESIRVHSPESLPDPTDAEDISIEEKTEALEDYERLLVTLKYVATGGRQFAIGALAKSFGINKAQPLIERVTPTSGFLQLQTLNANQASKVIEQEDPEALASILAQLETPLSIRIFYKLKPAIQNQVSHHIGNGYMLESEDYDTLDQRIAETIQTSQ